MRIGVLVALFLVSSLFRSVAQDLSEARPYGMDEAYQIYSLLLPHEEAFGFGKGTLIIQEDTVVHPLESGCFDPKAANRFRDALADYSNAQKRKWLLQRQFRIERPYELVSSDTINLLFKTRGVAGWEEFYKRYPASGGFIIMSPVGFNKAKTLAVVYAGSSCGGLCGLWRFHLLEKVDEKWKEARGVVCTTVS